MIDPIKVRSLSTAAQFPRSTSSIDPHSVIRVLRWYEENGDRLMGEAILDAVKLPELQELFQESADNLMVDSYPVSVAQVERLQSEFRNRLIWVLMIIIWNVTRFKGAIALYELCDRSKLSKSLA